MSPGKKQGREGGSEHEVTYKLPAKNNSMHCLCLRSIYQNILRGHLAGCKLVARGMTGEALVFWLYQKYLPLQVGIVLVSSWKMILYELFTVLPTKWLRVKAVFLATCINHPYGALQYDSNISTLLAQSFHKNPSAILHLLRKHFTDTFFRGVYLWMLTRITH